MQNVVARLRVGQLVLRVVVANPGQPVPVILRIETVEEGSVTVIGQIVSDGTEALMRSGRMFRILGFMLYGDGFKPENLLPDVDDAAGVLPGTRTIKE